MELLDTPIPPLKDGEVLVKIHAVSLQVSYSSFPNIPKVLSTLQYRDLIISNGTYPLGTKEGIIPCSDSAGEIISVSECVKNFKVGDRVCANFSLEHLFGDVVDEVQKANALGGKIDGCLTEVRAFPAYVCDVLLFF